MSTHKLKVKIGLLLVLAVLVLGLGVSPVEAIDWSWTGIASFKYLIHTSGEKVAEKAGLQKQDFEIEHVHLKIEAGLSDKLSLIVGPCLNHHEALSIRIAYLEVPLWEKDMETILSVEIGRFWVPFGRFNYLAEVTNYPTVSRPMMFASHSQDIISPHNYPHPIFMTEYSEMGLNFNGNKWSGEKHQFWYALWIGNGMYQSGFEGHLHEGGLGEGHDGAGTSLTDIAWLQEKRFASDNNENKAVGGRLSYSFGELLSLGGSYMSGKYDPHAELDYSALGVDLSLKLGPVKIDVEFVSSPTKFSAPDSTTTATANTLEDEYTTTGYYLQATLPFGGKWELVGMYDSLKRKGPELDEGILDPAELEDKENTINKISLGLNYSLSSDVKIKTEFVHFSFKAEGHEEGGGHTEPDDVHRISTALVISF